jgi:hypothetical protein
MRCNVRRTLKRAIAFGEPHPFLHDSVILLDHIIQVLALAQTNATRQRTFGFQCLDSCRIGGVLVVELAFAFSTAGSRLGVDIIVRLSASVIVPMVSICAGAWLRQRLTPRMTGQQHM